MVCTFFGHRDAPYEIEPKILNTILHLIESCSVDEFFVGNNGKFDIIVRKCLKQAKEYYPHIKYSVVLANLKVKKGEYYKQEDYDDTICPYVLEKMHPKYAIVKRNRWMVEQADYVVTYVWHSLGGSAQFKELAEKKGKVVINLTNQEQFNALKR